MGLWAATNKPETLFLETSSREALGVILNANLAPIGTMNWPTANLAIFVPFRLSGPYLVKKILWANGATAAGNIDVGVYSIGGARIFTTGSVAQSGTSAQQSSSATGGGISIPGPGNFFLAVAKDDISGSLLGCFTNTTASFARLFGVYQATSAFPLPDTVTFETVSATIGVPNAVLLGADVS